MTFADTAATLRTRPLLDLVVRNRRDPLGFLRRCAAEDGDLVVFAQAGSLLVVVNAPALIEEILVRRTSDFIKAHFVERRTLPWGEKILGDGLLNSVGARWLRQRRAMQPTFQRAQVAQYDQHIVDLTVRRIQSWADRPKIDLYGEMSELVLEILLRVVFGPSFSARELHGALRELFTHRDPRSLLYLLPEWVPTPANLRTRYALRRIDGVIFKAIAERRLAPSGTADLLSAFLRMDGEFDDGLVRDEIMSTLVAGHDTLTATLTWALDALTRHPEQQARIIEELVGHGPRDALGADLSDLGHLDGVAREVLRLFPPGKSIVRVSASDTELGGVHVPRNTSVVMSQWIVQRDPRNFADPDKFDPDRWSAGLATRLHRYAYFPFGGGPRLCLGIFLAELTLRLALAAIVRRVEFRGVRDDNEWDPATLRPKTKLMRVPAQRSGPY